MRNIGVSGNVEAIEAAFERSTRLGQVEVMAGVCEAGHLQHAQKLQAKNSSQLFPIRRLFLVIENRHIEMAKWLIVSNMAGAREEYLMIFNAAVGIGVVSFASWVRSTLGDLDKHQTLLCTAATSGSKEMFEWVLERLMGRSIGSIRVPHQIINIAAHCGHLGFVKWFYEKFPGCLSDYTLSEAVKSKNMELVRWLREEKHCDWSRDAVIAVVSNSDIAMLTWMLEHGCSANHEEMFLTALLQNNAEFIMWLFNNTSYRNNCYAGLSVVAGTGDLQAVETLWSALTPAEHHQERAHGHTAISDAAKKGHLHVVQWLLAHGHPFDRDAWDEARDNQHDETASWLCAQ